MINIKIESVLVQNFLRIQTVYTAARLLEFSGQSPPNNSKHDYDWLLLTASTCDASSINNLLQIISYSAPCGC